MNSLDKKVRYKHEQRGLCEEIYENVESVDCVGSTEKDHNVLIIRHDDRRSNTVIEPIEDLFSVEDIKTS